MLVSRRLPNDLQTIPKVNIIIDKESPTCEVCERNFKTGTGKIIHHTRIHHNNNNNQNTPSQAGFWKCGDVRCNTCKKGLFGDTIYITETKKIFKIKQKMTCKTENLIYCVTCQKCKEQYIGETGQELHNRQSGHFSDIRQIKAGLPYARHFLKCGIENYSIMGIEKVRSRDPLIRKQRELFYKELFKVKMK